MKSYFDEVQVQVASHVEETRVAHEIICDEKNYVDVMS